MAEIATWSMINTKVGIGLTTVECPPKTIIKSYSSQITINNDSSYGTNECVQLVDISTISYNYYLSVSPTTLQLAAAGETKSFTVTSYKRQVINGIEQSTNIAVDYTVTESISWASFTKSGNTVSVTASNNTGSTRSGTITIKQNEGTKSTTITISQLAANVSYNYYFSTNTSSLSYAGNAGSTQNVTVTSYKKQVINGQEQSAQTAVSFTATEELSWVSTSTTSTSAGITVTANASDSTRTGTVVLTQSESGNTVNVSISQSAGTKTYSNVTVALGNINDVPASGGTAAKPSVTYSQTWGWNGSTTGGGTITTGGTVSWSANVTGSNLGTTEKARTKIGTYTATVTLNGKSGSASKDVYQQANTITSTTSGTPVISLSASPATIVALGGTSTITASVSIPRTNHWTSGSTSTATPFTSNPTLSISGTGFSLSNKTVTATENTAITARTGTVTATYSGATTKTVNITQSAATYEFTISSDGQNYSTSVTYNYNANSTGQTYQLYGRSRCNGKSGVGYTTVSNNSWIHVTGNSWTVDNNTSTSQRTGSITLTQNVSGKVCTANIVQAGLNVTYTLELQSAQNPFVVTSTKAANGTIPSTGGAYSFSIASYSVAGSTITNIIPTITASNSSITSQYVFIVGDDNKYGSVLINVPDTLAEGNYTVTISTSNTTPITISITKLEVNYTLSLSAYVSAGYMYNVQMWSTEQEYLAASYVTAGQSMPMSTTTGEVIYVQGKVDEDSVCGFRNIQLKADNGTAFTPNMKLTAVDNDTQDYDGYLIYTSDANATVTITSGQIAVTGGTFESLYLHIFSNNYDGAPEFVINLTSSTTTADLSFTINGYEYPIMYQVYQYGETPPAYSNIDPGSSANITNLDATKKTYVNVWLMGYSDNVHTYYAVNIVDIHLSLNGVPSNIMQQNVSVMRSDTSVDDKYDPVYTILGNGNYALRFVSTDQGQNVEQNYHFGGFAITFKDDISYAIGGINVNFYKM